MKQIIPLALSYDDVLLVPQYSQVKSRSEVTISVRLTPRLTLDLPFTSANMSTVTGVDLAIALGKQGGLGILPRFDTAENQAEMVRIVKKSKVKVGAAVGCKNGYLERAEMLAKAGADIIVMDVAHGHMQSAIEATKNLKNHFKDSLEIIAGNTATEEATEALFKAGADCVKVGVGPGSICTTRTMTGFGVPQLTAVINSAKVAKKYKKTILADGGIKQPGDIAKALAAGASAVMIGNMFAGTDEAPGEIVEVNGKQFKRYNGSTSLSEKLTHSKKLNNLDKTYIKHIEGVEGLVPYKGSISVILDRLSASLRSSFSYAGAINLEQFWDNAQFIQVSSNALRENGAHDIILNEHVKIQSVNITVDSEATI